MRTLNPKKGFRSFAAYISFFFFFFEIGARQVGRTRGDALSTPPRRQTSSEDIHGALLRGRVLRRTRDEAVLEMRRGSLLFGGLPTARLVHAAQIRVCGTRVAECVEDEPVVVVVVVVVQGKEAFCAERMRAVSHDGDG